MALTRPAWVTNTIQSLANQVKGQATALKQAFDKASLDIKGYVDDLCDEIEAQFATKIETVKKTGDETIEGIKTFSSSPIVPTPTTSGQASTKGYVDTTVAGVVLGQIPDDSLTDAKLKQTGNNILPNFNAHLADNLYQVAGGTATAITLTIAETLENNLPVNFECSANNSGSATTINTKPFYKPGGTSAPTLIDGKYYTAIYNLAGDCFFLKASAEGNSVVGDVLATKTFSNDSDTGLIGTMPNRGAVTLTPSGSDQAILAGYHNGSGKVSAITLTAGENYILRDQTSASVNTTSYSKVKEYQIGYSGVIRVVMGIYATGLSTDAFGRIYVNGVAVGTERSTSSTTTVSFTEDIPISAGDLVQMYVKKAGTNSVAYSEFYLKIGNTPQVYV